MYLIFKRSGRKSKHFILLTILIEKVWNEITVSTKKITVHVKVYLIQKSILPFFTILECNSNGECQDIQLNLYSEY